MKKIIGTLLAACIILAACNTNTAENKTPATDTAKHEAHALMPAPAEKKFTGIAFANKQDYVCGMPVTAGVEDTVTYKGKLYGFCSSECKDEFVKKPGQYLAAGK